MNLVAESGSPPSPRQTRSQGRRLTAYQAARGTALPSSSQTSLLGSPLAHWGWLWLGVLGLVGGCSDSQDLLELETSDGIPLKSLATDATERVILLFDPAECFTCYSGLGAWLHWGRREDRVVVLVLTRDPTPVERRAMLLSGFQESAVLQHRMADRTPIQVYIRGEKQPRIEYRITDASVFQSISDIQQNHYP